MRKRALAIALCLMMVSAFAMMSVASAATATIEPVGQSNIEQITIVNDNGVTLFSGTVNKDTGHVAFHVYDNEGNLIADVNTNN